MSQLQDDLAQQIWQAYVAEIGRALPEGLADKMADHVIQAMSLAAGRWTVDTRRYNDCDEGLVGPFVTEAQARMWIDQNIEDEHARNYAHARKVVAP
jgi:hypothetical protein